MTTFAILQPGHMMPCQTCVHRLDLCHANPCEVLHWEESRHVKPDLRRGSDGVVTCSDYLPATSTPGEEPSHPLGL